MEKINTSGENQGSSNNEQSPWDILQPEVSDYSEKDPLEAPDWTNVERLLDEVDIPKDPRERADFVAAILTDKKDLELLTVAMHEVLVPGVDTTPNQKAGAILNPSGDVIKATASPEEREEISEYASDLIRQLNEIRSKTGDDQSYLDRVANIVGMETVLKHTYEDGNGRLARVMAHLISAGPENQEWDDELGGEPGSALRFMSSSKEGQRLTGGRNPNRIDSLGDSYSPVGFIPAEGLSSREILDRAAGIGIAFSDKENYKKQYASAGMMYGD